MQYPQGPFWRRPLNNPDAHFRPNAPGLNRPFPQAQTNRGAPAQPNNPYVANLKVRTQWAKATIDEIESRGLSWYKAWRSPQFDATRTIREWEQLAAQCSPYYGLKPCCEVLADCIRRLRYITSS